MKNRWNEITGIVSAIAIYFAASVSFPHIDNKALSQARGNYERFSILIMIVVYLIFTFISRKMETKRYAGFYAAAGIFALSCWVAFLFLSYYPFINRNVFNLQQACGGTFLKGEKLNNDKLNSASGINYDSLSANDPANLIQFTDCTPENAWKEESIQSNFNQIVFKYIVLIVFFSAGIFSLMQAAFLKIL
jgi:hypothetical protein